MNREQPIEEKHEPPPSPGTTKINEFYESREPSTLRTGFFEDFRGDLGDLVKIEEIPSNGIGPVVSYVGRVNGSRVTIGFSMIPGYSNRAYLMGSAIEQFHESEVEEVRRAFSKYGFVKK